MYSQSMFQIISNDLNINESSISNTAMLINDGATIPFIARYRKERTGGLDETEIKNISEKLEYYQELAKRKETILKTIDEQGKLTPELKRSIIECKDKQKLEDIYLPYKPKKKTRARIAKEKGLEPLADIILFQQDVHKTKEEIVSSFIDQDKGVSTYEEALAGALDIVAEKISDNAEIRGWLRNFAKSYGSIESKVKKKWEGKKSKYEAYYNFSESIDKSPSHRLLAIRRGSHEEVLSWKISLSDEEALAFIKSKIIKNRDSIFYTDLIDAINDSFYRLVYPSVETEVFNQRIEDAEKEAISVFSKNLKNLLLAPPAGHKMIMGVDPGFRTGCKLAVIDQNGTYKEYKAIFPHEPFNKREEAEKIVLDFINRYHIDLISIGNGTASKESRIFIEDVIKRNNLSAKAVIVSEAGASVYSASDIAIKEFPDLDVTVRGAISIARRVQDPLAELVKIDPKSIGVGQYQHDVNQGELKKALDLTVESCVNFVGVELNTSSASLLSYISGIGKAVAENIVQYRLDNGAFKSRNDLLKVPKIGGKVFEQCAGFLRIRQSHNPLDNSAIHPESYYIVEKMAQDTEIDIRNLIGNEGMISKIKLSDYISEKVGLPTLHDIIQELKKPGLDPRREFSNINFNSDINEIEDLKVDMVLEGTITNVTNFGAFVDIGVHQDGLIHISKLSSKFVKNPHDIVAVGDIVRVKVISVDNELKRIGLERISEN